jgi:hypothetical protein
MMPDEFTAEEKAYVDSRGEQGPAVEETTQEPVQTPGPLPDGQIPNAAEDAVGKQLPPKAEEERVPVAAIQEERRRRKEAEKQANELRAQYARLEGRVEGLQDRQQPQQQDQAEEDPLARLERLERVAQQQQQIDQVRNVHAELGSRFDHAVNQYKTEAPDVTQALEFLVRSRERELTEVHGIPAERVKPMLGQEMFQFLANAQARGVDPARAAYQWAKERGYQAKAADQPDPAATARNDMARTTAGMAASKSLGQASGAPGGEVSLDIIADMSPKELTKWLSVPANVEHMRRLHGG